MSALQELLPWKGRVHAARQWRHAHTGGGGRTSHLHTGRAREGGHPPALPFPFPLSCAKLPAVGGRDFAIQHPGPRTHLQPAAGAPPYPSGTLYHLQSPGDLLPAQVRVTDVEDSSTGRTDAECLLIPEPWDLTWATPLSCVQERGHTHCGRLSCARYSSEAGDLALHLSAADLWGTGALSAEDLSLPWVQNGGCVP